MNAARVVGELKTTAMMAICLGTVAMLWGVGGWNHNQVMAGGGMVIGGCIVWNYCTRWAEKHDVRSTDEI